MRDDDAGDFDGFSPDPLGGTRPFASTEDLFGDLFVLGPGVLIMLDGRPISAPWP